MLQAYLPVNTIWLLDCILGRFSFLSAPPLAKFRQP